MTSEFDYLHVDAGDDCRRRLIKKLLVLESATSSKINTYFPFVCPKSRWESTKCIFADQCHMMMCVCVQVFLCGVCGSVGRSRFGSGSHQRRPLELLHVRPPEHLRVTATPGRLALQATALLCQQPRTGLRKSGC